MESFDAWWRNVVVSLLGPCFLVGAALSFHYDEKAAPLFEGLASGLASVTNAARDATQPLLLLPALLNRDDAQQRV